LPAGRQARGARLLLPRDNHMPQPSPIKPGPSPQADARAFWHGDGSLPPARPAGAAEAGEAAWHHNEAFEQLAARVECLSVRLEATRSALDAGGLDLFEGVADALLGLKTAIAGLRCAWESDDPSPVRLPGAPRPVAAVAPSTPAAADPWDAETAEALTRVCEIAALEERQRAAGRRAPLARPTATPAEPPATRASGLDARLADLTDRLNQALPGLDPAQWLDPLDQRVRQLDRAGAAPAGRATIAPEVPSLGGVETLIGDLAVQVEHTRAELGRLDAIEGHLREVIGRLKDLTATAKVAPLAPAEPTPERDAADRLEALLKGSLAARRQDARAAVGVLKSIHHAVGQITDRLDALRPGERAADQGLAGQTDPDADRDLLLKAYREGARALGETLPDAGYEPLEAAADGRGPTRYDWSASNWHWHAKD
jgi:hypothetical protein